MPTHPSSPIDLFDRVVSLIEEGRHLASSSVNAALTLTYWRVGSLVHSDVLGDSGADYGKQIVATLGRQLRQRYGPGYDKSNLTRMMAFAKAFPDVGIVGALSQQLSWTHFRKLLPVKSDEARQFHAREAVEKRLRNCHPQNSPPWEGWRRSRRGGFSRPQRRPPRQSLRDCHPS